jgi:REP element-mobilizing transposase RayT
MAGCRVSRAPRKVVSMAESEIFKPDGWHSRGYLPHFEGGEIPQAITFRLHDSLPQAVLERWRREIAHQGKQRTDVELRRRIEIHLDQGYGSAHLKNPRLATLVQDALLHFDSSRYRLSAWVVMPNHVHLLVTPRSGYPLSRIMHSLKSYTSQEANKWLERKGKFWMDEYFDRFIRDAKHFAQTIAYIENNPVKAHLCKTPQEWRFSSAWFRARQS